MPRSAARALPCRRSHAPARLSNASWWRWSEKLPLRRVRALAKILPVWIVVTLVCSFASSQTPFPPERLHGDSDDVSFPGFMAQAPFDPQRAIDQWYGVGWDVTNEYFSDIVAIAFDVIGGSGTADVYVPILGVFHDSLPVTIVGDAITIGDPEVFGLTGTITGETMGGEAWQSGLLIAIWYLEKDVGAPTNPGPAPGVPCDDLPPLSCTGGTEYCTELIPFEPDEGPGYWDYPIPGETAEDQSYSYLRRDAVMLIKYAAAKVACKTADWDYGNLAPLGLGDMSEADGSTPGTDIGQPRHPPGTHVDGNDIDAAYYQLFSPDDLLRPVGDYYIGTENQYRIIGDPYALDVWRTALFIAYLSEHPDLRVIGVDGQVGLLLELALTQLVALGWIDGDLYESIPLAYELTDQGHGWYRFHHTHMHMSMIAILFADGFESGDTSAWSATVP